MFLREHHDGMYRASVYYTSKMIAEVGTKYTLDDGFHWLKCPLNIDIYTSGISIKVNLYAQKQY